MQVVKKTASYCSSSAIALGVLLFVTTASAQPPPVVHHPGDVVTITIVFEGVDAHKIQTAIAYFGLPNVASDQAGFIGDFAFTDCKPDGPGTLKLSYKILTNAASGVYRLTQIRAGTSGDGPITVTYNEGLPTLNLTIENDRHFVKPTIKSVKEP
jgi:hypothetical protein